MMKKIIVSGLQAALLSTISLTSVVTAGTHAAKDVVENYADIALAGYQDALQGALELQSSINTLIANPSQAALDSARQAWRDARVPYMQTEVFRFGNEIVDDWEGKVNAWPLDEGLIDYVDNSLYGSESEENDLYSANVIANSRLVFSGKTIDASVISTALLQDELHEADGNEANVATGYHAIEFLLWGQDLHGTNAGAGQRLATDFAVDNCSNGHCDRRVAYLNAATDLLVDDLGWMVSQWTDQGAARARLEANPDDGLNAIFTGMGSLSYGELAGERMQLGLILHDPEEEHDCFADNTHYSHYYDAKGIQNVYTGSYTRIDGSVISGPSLSSLVKATAPKVDEQLNRGLTNTLSAMQKLVDSAAQGQAYDQMIGEGNAAGNQAVQAAIDALVAQTSAISDAVTVLGLNTIDFAGSDSLDSPDSIQ